MKAIQTARKLQIPFLLASLLFAWQICPSAAADAATQSQGRLEAMGDQSDLVFKGEVLSTALVTNPAFTLTGMDTYATKLKIISILKGQTTNGTIVFEHYHAWRPGGNVWDGPRPPTFFSFEVGQSYVVFAANLDKPDTFYSPPPGFKRAANEYRQIYAYGITRALDSRPLNGFTIKEAHWFEFNLLLNDANPTNEVYAIDNLDHLSLSGQVRDEWHPSTDDFKRTSVLTALLPLLTNNNEQVANRAISCFTTDSNSIARLEPFAEALVSVANHAPLASSRVDAIQALSGLSSQAVLNSLISLLNDPDEDIRHSAVDLLPRFPREFAEAALRTSADDTSARVRSAVAIVIGNEKYQKLLPTLAILFTDPVGLNNQQTIDSLRSGAQWDTTGDVHTSAGFALLKFEPEQVASILKTNLEDAGFHDYFIAKMAEKDTAPWLPELVRILEIRKKSDPGAPYLLNGAYSKCWEDIHQYLFRLPKEKLSSNDNAHYFDVLEDMVQNGDGRLRHEGSDLYVFYKTNGLSDRVAKLRQKYPRYAWWFDDYDKQHPQTDPSHTP
jgi:HEAT repeats